MLDTENIDRSYLFGRAYALLNHMEYRGKLDKGKPRNVALDTHAINNLKSMELKPSQTFSRVQQNAYVHGKNSRHFGYFENELNTILSKLSVDDFNSKTKLSPLFLLGYGHQTKELNTFKELENTKNNDEKGEN